MSIWTPRVTVAAIVNNQQKFLLVKEKPSGKIVFNQPAGHLEENESLTQAIIREMYEETGLDFVPTHLVGIYRWQQHSKNRTYLRFAFTGEVSSTQVNPKDEDIIEALWLDLEQINEISQQLRSPQVMAGINDYLNGIRYNINLLRDTF